MNTFKHNVVLNKYLNIAKEDLNNINNKIIILNGERGSGRTTLLSDIKKEENEINYNIVFDTFTRSVHFFDYSEKFIKHYYEVMLTYQLLKSKDRLINHILQGIYLPCINDLIKECNKYINNEENNKLSMYLEPFDLMYPIIKEIKDNQPGKRFNAYFDNFDLDKSKYIQEVIQEYFQLFDKNIIVSRDNSENTKDNLIKYDFYQLTYGSDINFVKELLISNIESYNKDNIIEFDEKYITNNIVKELIIKTNGNIKEILDIFYYILINYDCLDSFDLYFYNKINNLFVSKEDTYERKLTIK